MLSLYKYSCSTFRFHKPHKLTHIKPNLVKFRLNDKQYCDMELEETAVTT
jgi:hypothetical protein